MSHPPVNPNRIRLLSKTRTVSAGPVVYWMQRDQRLKDNWALVYAQQLAKQYKQPLVIVFNVVPHYLEATIRQYGFMLKGLQQVVEDAVHKNISFAVTSGDPVEEIPAFIHALHAGALVTDFSPLRINRRWKLGVTKQISIPFFEVDAHNVVPTWIASPKLEFGAYTLRPKIHRLLPEYMEDFPSITKHGYALEKKLSQPNWSAIEKSLRVNRDIPEVGWIVPGERAAYGAMKKFFQSRFKRYAEDRNNPTLEAQSELSPYLHFGQLSAQRLALEAQQFPHSDNRDAFLEELIVRRELADNFCFYNERYDSFAGFPAWAQKTLNEHRHDKREYVYSYKQLEQGKTHDELWNAAQLQMVHHGKMHNYMRMYWAKKILEWTPDPETALKYAITLNDTYELDGRDPNGYVGCAWSIGGVHDRAWGERPIFGKIRYMSYNGAKGKFDIAGYITQVNALAKRTLL